MFFKFERLSLGILAAGHHQHPQWLLCHLAASLWRMVRAKSGRATVNSFITRSSFHLATSAPKVPAEPCSAISSANAPTGIVQMLTKDHHPGKCFSTKLWKMGSWGGYTCQIYFVGDVPVLSLLKLKRGVQGPTLWL